MKTQTVPTNSVHNHNTTNNNNNIVINLNYLNTECKDATSFYDFVQTVKITKNDRELLELFKYENAVSDIWKRNYRALAIHERPLYCVQTDPLVVFAKGEEEWKEQFDSEFVATLEAPRSKNKSYMMKDVLLSTTAACARESMNCTRRPQPLMKRCFCG
jgi:hypothetical protein